MKELINWLLKLMADRLPPPPVPPPPVPPPDEIPQPLILGEITGQELRRLLCNYFPSEDLHIADGLYATTNLASYQHFLDWDKTDEMKYRSEYHDCDNFAFSLLGKLRGIPDWDSTPSGLIWGNFGQGDHAINLFCDYKHELYYIEPQTDQITPVSRLSNVLLIVI